MAHAAEGEKTTREHGGCPEPGVIAAESFSRGADRARARERDVTGAEIVPAAAAGPKRQSEKGKIKRLPPTLRAEFERRLMEGAFSDYRGLSRWLAGHGYHISHAALHKHGHALERKLDALRLATEQARVVVEASGAA